ncbi:hypothetical protein NSP_43350 [Nodularia spumigena CCY9414]|nr:hypothetical protein NSP_43350 [Nodularia spumigena CCY9414]
MSTKISNYVKPSAIKQVFLDLAIKYIQNFFISGLGIGDWGLGICEAPPVF